MSNLESACKFLGWQGGTVHQAKAELRKREESMIRQYNQMDEESDAEAAEILRRDIATAQVLQLVLA